MAPAGRCTSMDATCTWREASNAAMRTYESGAALTHAAISLRTWLGSVQPNMGSFHMVQ